MHHLFSAAGRGVGHRGRGRRREAEGTAAAGGRGSAHFVVADVGMEVFDGVHAAAEAAGLGPEAEVGVVRVREDAGVVVVAKAVKGSGKCMRKDVHVDAKERQWKAVRCCSN